MKNIPLTYLLSLFVILGSLKASAQNNKVDLVKRDTMGQDYTFNLIMRDIDLSQVTKLAIVKRYREEDPEIMVKEILISPMGDHYIVFDEQNQHIIKDFLSSVIRISKVEYKAGVKLYFKTHHKNGKISENHVNGKN